jgi:hypothetical protein
VLHALVLAVALSAPPAAPIPVPAPGAPRTSAPPPAATAPSGPEAPSPLAGAPQDVVPLSEAPPEWSSALGKAQAAGRDFQQALQARLGAALAQGGPAAAIDVCASDAQRIGAEAASASAVKMGRTSDRLRNPANTPPAWARTLVQLSAGEKAADVPGVAVDLGGHLGVLLPIGVKPACLGCHGAPASMSPKVKDALAQRYPADRAVGYAEGDFRGYLWVEVRK